MVGNLLIPKFLKELTQYIPAIAFKTLDWKGVLKEMAPLMLKLGKGQLSEQYRESIQKLGITNLELVSTIITSKSNPTKQGEAVLRLYFAQFQNNDGLCLDLRSKYFTLDENKLQWNPNNFWYTFDEDFRLGVNSLYSGFYLKDNELFEKGLDQLGLTQGLEASSKETLKSLFHQHFGPGDQDHVLFRINEFTDSFFELFDFFVKHNIKLHKDFIFLGLYLVTLYLHLEELDVELDVRSAFMDVKPN
jgi:hypothetical protein